MIIRLFTDEPGIEKGNHTFKYNQTYIHQRPTGTLIPPGPLTPPNPIQPGPQPGTGIGGGFLTTSPIRSGTCFKACCVHPFTASYAPPTSVFSFPFASTATFDDFDNDDSLSDDTDPLN